MNNTEFRAAVEKIIGVPPAVDGKGLAEWRLQVSGGMLKVSHHESMQHGGWKFPYFLALKFLHYFSPGLGEDPVSGRWDIRDSYFNHDPEAVLRELVRRLARAGYEVPKGEPVSPEPVFHRGILSVPETESFETAIELLDYPNPEGLLPIEARWRNVARELKGRYDRLRSCSPATGPTCKDPHDILIEPPAGLAITLTQDEQRHLAALLETAVEPQENRPSGFVGQQDAWNSILGKLKP